ncbi:MAG: beta-N-acetylhexosaminidase, partial [Cytophagales bacterium]|nr:beta-N-acetylhexosaminidase [Cytophagales bacterium]
EEAPYSVLLSLQPELEPEAYTLTVEKGQLRLAGGSATGVFYGIQSLIQVLEQSPGNRWPVLTISDGPRFAWRGAHF